MKKKFLILIIVLVLSLFLVRYDVDAVTGTDDTSHSTYTATEESTRSVVPGLGCVYTSDYGTCEGKNIHVSLLTQTCDIEKQNTKVVSWAIKNNTGFTRANVARICADYEANHPGWIVLGGINSDQYTLGFGNGFGANGKAPYSVQPYYPLFADGEKWFSNTWMSSGEGSNGNFCGLYSDGRADSLVKVSAKTALTHFTCQILDKDGNVTATYPVDSLNGTGETVVYSGYYSDTEFGTFLVKNDKGVNLQQTFIVENADIAYCSNYSGYTNCGGNEQDAFFGVGTISKKAPVFDLNKGQFAISTNNSELASALNIGVKIRCQYEYIDEEINAITDCVGFHTVQRDNNVDNPVSGSYNTNSRPRAVIGRKITGQVVLMVIDDYKNTYGVTGYGINAICQAYSICEAYQMDGGGSAQMAVRTDNGTFEAVTVSDDSGTTTSQRSILTAVLFVAKDPNAKPDYKVTYELNGGSVGNTVLPEIYNSYSDLVLPNVRKEGYEFAGWYLDENFTEKVSKKVSGDITLYAYLILRGDMDKDDTITLKDAILLKLYIYGKLDDDLYYDYASDYNNDGDFNLSDVKALQEKIIE